MSLLIIFIDVYSVVVIGAVIVAWMSVPATNQVTSIINRLTDPLLAPIRNVMPTIGGIDLSPLVLLTGLQILRGLLIPG